MKNVTLSIFDWSTVSWMTLQKRYDIFNVDQTAISMRFCNSRCWFNTNCDFEVLRFSFNFSYCIISSNKYLNFAIASQYCASLVGASLCFFLANGHYLSDATCLTPKNAIITLVNDLGDVRVPFLLLLLCFVIWAKLQAHLSSHISFLVNALFGSVVDHMWQLILCVNHRTNAVWQHDTGNSSRLALKSIIYSLLATLNSNRSLYPWERLNLFHSADASYNC